MGGFRRCFHFGRRLHGLQARVKGSVTESLVGVRQQVPHEEVRLPPARRSGVAAGAVAAAGDDDQVEVLVGLDRAR